MKTRRDILLGLGGLAGLMSMASFAWADAGDLVRISGRAFGTRWQVTVPADADAGGLGADLRKILAGIDQSMSPFLRQYVVRSAFDCIDSFSSTRAR